MRPDPGTARYLRNVLVRWYRKGRRDLPWRRTSDPYAIWVSETMLQQTRVAAVIPYYERFLERFPDVSSLSAATIDDVLSRWAGLGYYRRARLLKEAAEVTVRDHGGEVPREFDRLIALPGVGRYTAGAILSIAFGLPVPVLDGNVFRVYSRFLAIDGSWSSGGDKTRFWDLAERVVPERNAGDFNQALMELGALVCAPKSPECGRCPVRRRCAALAAGEVDRYPSPRKRAVTEKVKRDLYLVTDRKGRLLLCRRPEGGRMGGMWELPDELPPGARRLEKVGSFRHAILNKSYEVDVYRARAAGAAGPGEDGRWIAREEIGDYAVTAMARKGIEMG